MISFTTRVALVGALAIGTLMSCDAEKPKRSSGDVLQALAPGDALLVANIGEAATAFEQRLRQRVTDRDGIVLVKDMPELSMIEAFPATVPWSISCGRYVGLSISFGSGTTHDSDIIEVELSRAALTQAQCRQLLPLLGRNIETLLH